MGGKKRKAAGKDGDSKRTKLTDPNTGGNAEAAVLPGDWWATLKEAEERAQAATECTEARDLQDCSRRAVELARVSPARGGARILRSRGVPERPVIRADRGKTNGVKRSEQNTPGSKVDSRDRKRKVERVSNSQKRGRLTWSSDSDEEKDLGMRTPGGESQDAFTTAWEQYGELRSERAMREAVAQGEVALARTESEQESVGRKCTEKSHPLRQDSDGLYCGRCGCFVRQLTEGDVQQPKSATGYAELRSLVRRRDPQTPQKKKQVGVRPGGILAGVTISRGEEQVNFFAPVTESARGESFLMEQMKAHQREAYLFVKRALLGDPKSGGEGGGAILWLSPGLGKTLVVSRNLVFGETQKVFAPTVIRLG